MRTFISLFFCVASVSGCSLSGEDEPARAAPTAESTRQLSARETGCSGVDVNIKDYEEVKRSDDSVEARWNVTCHGRVFRCTTDGCKLDEVASRHRDIDPDAILVQRHNECEGSSVQKACHELALDYELGRHGVPPDRFAAISFYQKSCELGNKDDCRRSTLLRGAR
jgi:hypothetical protein